MNKKDKYGSLVSDLGQYTKNAFNEMLHRIDKNNDGTLNSKDISVIADNIESMVTKGAKTVKDITAKQVKLFEEKTLQPVMPEELSSPDFHVSRFIRITPRDKKYADSEVCKGSVGYRSYLKGSYMLNIFDDSLDAFGLSLLPDDSYEFYFVDPADRNSYIALDRYFSYIQEACVAELRKIAQDLGAKHFVVTYKEEQLSFSEKTSRGHAEAGGSAAEAGQKNTEKKYSAVSIEAESSFPGHEPVRPQLKYLRRNTNIQSLIDMRMDPSSPLQHDKYTISLINSCGIREKDAVKIDGILKSVKCSTNASVMGEVEHERRKYLDYEIDF